MYISSSLSPRQCLDRYAFRASKAFTSESHPNIASATMHTTTCTSLTTYSATSPDRRSSTELRSSSVPHRPPTRRHRCHRGSGLAQPRLGHARFGPRGSQIRPSPLLPPPLAASATGLLPQDVRKPPNLDLHGQIWLSPVQPLPPVRDGSLSALGGEEGQATGRLRSEEKEEGKKEREGRREGGKRREGGGGAGHHRRRRRCWWPRGRRPCTREVGEAGFTSRVAERGDTGVRCGRVEEIQNSRNLIQYCSFVTFSFYNFG